MDGKIQKTLGTVFPLFAISLGTVGEFLSIIVFSKAKFIATSFSFYSISQSIIHILVFYVGYLKFYLKVIDADPITHSVFWCKVLRYLVRPMLEIVSWIQLLMTLDRYLFIHFQSRFKVIRELWCQAILVGIVSLILMLYHIPVAIFYGLYETSKNTSNTTIKTINCFPSDDVFYVSMLNDLGFFFLFCVIPFTIMFFLTLSMSISFIKMKRKTQIQSRFTRKTTKQYRFVFAIIFQNILFFILTLPQSSLWPIISLQTAGIIKLSSYDSAILDLIQTIFSFLMYLYLATKFIMNLAFNSLYRQIFIETFLCFRRKPQQKSVTFTVSKATF